MSEKLALYEIPYSDSGSLSDATLEHPSAAGGLTLQFEYERDEEWYIGTLLFERVRCFRFSAEAHTTVWHSEGAFDTLVEVQNSAWAAEVTGNSPGGSTDWTLRHYLIFVSSMGAYEILAESWKANEEAQVR